MNPGKAHIQNKTKGRYSLRADPGLLTWVSVLPLLKEQALQECDFTVFVFRETFPTSGIQTMTLVQRPSEHPGQVSLTAY